MMPPRFVARQLSKPAGLLGRLFGKLMNRHNAKMNAFALQLLEAGPADRVVEIGFGGGIALSRLIDSTGFVAGIDRSPDAVRWARSKFSEPVAKGMVTFQLGLVEALPLDDETFDKAITVNTVYFWKSLKCGFREIHRILVPGGKVVIGFLPKEFMDKMKMPTDIFTTRTVDDVVGAARAAGFYEICLQRPQPETSWVIMVASRTRDSMLMGTEIEEHT